MTVTAERLPTINFSSANGSPAPVLSPIAEAPASRPVGLPLMMPIPQAPAAEKLLAVVQRAMSDPGVDIDKLERLVALYERALARDAEAEFNEALTKCQEEVRPIATDAKNDVTKSRYASYLALDAAIRPIYVKYGFSLSFNTEDGAPPEHIRVVCYVARKNHTRKYQADLPSDGKGARGGDVMSKTHAAGAGMTYGQRYLLKMIFNLVIGEDNDGNQIADRPFITKAQVQSLEAMAKQIGVDIERFCKLAMRVNSLSEILAKDYAHAVATMDRKRTAPPKNVK